MSCLQIQYTQVCHNDNGQHWPCVIPNLIHRNMTLCFFGALHRLTSKESLSLYTSPSSVTGSNHNRPHLKQCDLLPLTRRQKRLCRKEPGLAEALKEAVRLGIVECQYQLRSERWNCSLQGRGNLLKRGKSPRLTAHVIIHTLGAILLQG